MKKVFFMSRAAGSAAKKEPSALARFACRVVKMLLFLPWHVFSIIISVFSGWPIWWFLYQAPWEKLSLDAGKNYPVSAEHAYHKLPQAELEVQMRVAHDLTQKIDEKTSKTVFIVGFLATFVNFYILDQKKELMRSDTVMYVLIDVLAVYFSAHMLFAVYIAVETLRTAIVYGLGTPLLAEMMKKGKKAIVDDLVKMENLTYEAKVEYNETAYLCLRNSVVSIGLIMGVIFIDYFFPSVASELALFFGELGKLWLSFWI